MRYAGAAGDRGYHGTLWLESGLSDDQAVTAVSTAYAIVRQGRRRVEISLGAIRDRTLLQDLPGLPRDGTQPELERIYGPQPGDGKPSS